MLAGQAVVGAESANGGRVIPSQGLIRGSTTFPCHTLSETGYRRERYRSLCRRAPAPAIAGWYAFDRVR